MESVRGSNASVHVGCFNTDHFSLLAKDPERSPKYAGTGAAASMLSNRLSWFYDLKGPSLTIDTACSSSMVALDLACQALQNGTSDMASVTDWIHHCVHLLTYYLDIRGLLGAAILYSALT